MAVGSLLITAFSKQHDAADPHSFIISCTGVTIGVITDIGEVCKEVTHHFKQCNAVFLEANYDVAMLENGKYPVYLKNRICGGKGHISNDEALGLFINHRSPHLTHLLLSHLSKENNSPELVLDLFKPHANGTEIIIAPRYEQTPVYHIQTFKAGLKKTAMVFLEPSQLNLFN